MNTKPQKLTERRNIVWTIATKDILDGLRNKLVLSMVLGVLFMLLMPSLLTWMIEPPYANVLVYDPGNSQLVSLLDEDKAFRITRLPSFERFESTVAETGFAMGIEYGLLVPEDFDQHQAAGEAATVEVYVPWSYRFKIARISQQIEQQLSTLSGVPVQVDYQGNYVYPSIQSTTLLGLSAWLPVIIILMVGLNMMPQLFFEEKQTRTFDALMVSPASEWQVVAGKALVGMFYILVTALVAFGLNWNKIVHWEMVLLFVVCGGLFGIGVGLVLGSFFQRWMEIIGWSMLIFMLLIAAIFVQMLDLDLPGIVLKLLPWVPSAAMTELIIGSYLEVIDWGAAMMNVGSLLAISLVLYALVVWRLRRSDR